MAKVIMNWKTFLYLIKIFLFSVVYFLTAKLGLSLDAESGFASLVWLPTGISLWALLVFGSKLWPGVAVGAFVTNFLAGATVFVAVGISFGNTLEALVGLYLVRKISGFDFRFGRLKDVLEFILRAGVVSTLASASIGVMSLYLGGIIDLSAVRSTWVAWWVGNVLSNLVVAPFLLVWSYRPVFNFSKKILIEVLFFVVSVFFIGLIVFRYPYRILEADSPFTYLVFPVLIWGALRFYQRGATSGMFIFSLIAVVCTSYGFGPFVSDSLGQSLFYLQSFMGTVAVTMLIFGSVVTERSMLATRKDEFISMASHELKTPLTAIKGFNQMLLRLSVPPDKLYLYLTKMDGSINRLAKLVDELLDVSRIQTGKLSLKRDECDVYDLVNDAIGEMQLVEPGHVIIFSDYTHKIIKVDKFRIHQVLFNLLTNAMKFSAKEKEIVVAVQEKNGFVVVSVKDLGVGISKSNLLKIFEPFYQEGTHTVNSSSGLGLGLYISKQIITRHSGRIWIESEEGLGSTFLFSLPI